MTVEQAQREVRTVYLGGFPGQLVSGALWLVAAGLWIGSGPRYGILAMVFGGAGIFPATQLLLRAMGRPASLSDGNPLRYLAMQIAFTVPFNLPVVGAAALYRLEWFFPACMVVVGSHYLPFVFLYGMKHFAVLGGALIAGGVGIALYAPALAVASGWVTGALLIVFAFVGKRLASGSETP